MSSGIDDALSAFFDRLKQRQPVKEARRQLEEIYPIIHAAGVGETDALRTSSGQYKRLQDEVRPALIFASKSIPDGDIEFHLSDGAADATAWPDPTSAGISIEVTVALGKVRHHLMSELNEKGMAHGYADATDADSRDVIAGKYDEYKGYSPEEAGENLKKGVEYCVQKKAHLDSALVIAAPFESLRPDDWASLMPAIAAALPKCRCRSIHLVGKSLSKELCFQLK